MLLTMRFSALLGDYMVNLIFFFFFNDTATTEIYTLSLHDALPIFDAPDAEAAGHQQPVVVREELARGLRRVARSEEHTSELQSQSNLACRLLLEKKTTRPGPASARMVRVIDSPPHHVSDISCTSAS